MNGTNQNNVGNTLMVFVRGILIGAVLAVLFTPRKGSDVRNNIKKKANELMDKKNDKKDNLLNKADQKIDELRDKTEDVAGDVADKAEDGIQQARNRSSRTPRP